MCFQNCIIFLQDEEGQLYFDKILMVNRRFFYLFSLLSQHKFVFSNRQNTLRISALQEGIKLLYKSNLKIIIKYPCLLGHPVYDIF